MRSHRGPNWWAASALLFCLASWSLGIAALARTANLYEHRSTAGFRHDLIVRAEQRMEKIERIAPRLTIQ